MFLSERDDAIFALDHSDRIIHWNRACEELLGFKAREVLGKRCYEVLSGEDVHGNPYCYSSCPVIYQTRRPKPRPVYDFPLWVMTAEGERKLVYFSSKTAPSPHSELPTIVHGVSDQGVSSDSPGESEVRAGVLHALTQREIDVLRCLGQGMTTHAIGTSLAISSTTVRNHVQSILQKLNVHTRAAAVGIAYQTGLISSPRRRR